MEKQTMKIIDEMIVTGWGGMLVWRRLLIAAAIAASVGASASSASFPDIPGYSDFSGYPGFSVFVRSATSSVGPFTTTAPSSGCRLSEFLCNTGHCISQDKFCDGEDDCGDKSDEPRYCTRKFHTANIIKNIYYHLLFIF